MTGPRTPVRDLAIGIGTGLGTIGLVFFGTAAAVEFATLVLTVGMLIWFATVPASRLATGPGRPAPMLFGLAVLGTALMLTAAIFLATLTVYAAAMVAAAALAVGLTRALGHRTDPVGREE